MPPAVLVTRHRVQRYNKKLKQPNAIHNFLRTLPNPILPILRRQVSLETASCAPMGLNEH